MKYTLPIFAILIASTVYAATNYTSFFTYYAGQKDALLQELETLKSINYNAERTNINYNFTINTTDTKARKDELMRLVKDMGGNNISGGCYSNGNRPMPYDANSNAIMATPTNYNCNINAAFETEKGKEVAAKLAKMATYSDMNESTYTDVWRQNSVEQYKVSIMHYLSLLELTDDVTSISDTVALMTALSSANMQNMNMKMNAIDPNMKDTSYINIQLNTEYQEPPVMMDGTTMAPPMPVLLEKAAPSHPLPAQG